MGVTIDIVAVDAKHFNWSPCGEAGGDRGSSVLQRVGTDFTAQGQDLQQHVVSAAAG